LKEVGEHIAAFAMPALESARTQSKDDLKWKPLGPWKKLA
jgi:hypothetical protein